MFCLSLLALLVAGVNAQDYWGDGAFYYGGGDMSFYGGGLGYDYWGNGLPFGFPFGQTPQREYQVVLEGGLSPNEGRVVLIKDGRNGTICDYGWEQEEANTVCRQLGYEKGGVPVLHSAFEPSKKEVWLSYVNCRNGQTNLNDCQYSKIYPNNRLSMSRFCNNDHEAGVVCHSNAPSTTASPTTAGTTTTPVVVVPDIKLVMTGDSFKTGKIQMKKDGELVNICGEGWNIKNSIVACKQLNPKWYAKRAFTSPAFEIGDHITLTCTGEEDDIQSCTQTHTEDCTTIASVECTEYAPDLYLHERYLNDNIKLRRTYRLNEIKCAIEEKCVAQSALNPFIPPGQPFPRAFITFSAMVMNGGTADFRPLGDPDDWEYHACHQHFHSIAEFAYYDVVSADGKTKVESGHKVSYCLRDSYCVGGARPKYYCTQFRRNGLTQGISVNCGDLYGNELDCQWVDITDVPDGDYYLEIRLNPHKLVAELDFNNNFYRCPFRYQNGYITHSPCTVGR